MYNSSKDLRLRLLVRFFCYVPGELCRSCNRQSNGRMALVPPEKSRRSFPLIEYTETLTKLPVSIATQLTVDNLAKCHLQEQSPLFKVAAELRNLIFEYATQPYDDPESHYNSTDLYYRPEHRARHITSCSLLLSYRRVWLEANHLPMQQADHAFWFKDYPQRRPKYLDKINDNEGNRLDRM